MRAVRSLPLLFAFTALGCAPAGQPPASPSAVTSSASTNATALGFDAEAEALRNELVSFDTSHGNETVAMKPIADRFRAVGVPVAILESAPGRGNLIARVKGTGAKKPLVLLAHVDVVPVDAQGWETPPFKVTVKDGFAHARGINDDKGAAAAMVATALEVARAKAPLARDLIVVLTSGEETGGFAGTGWLVQKHREVFADADVALNEGGGLMIADDQSRVLAATIVVTERTYQSFKLAVKSSGGHSAQPFADPEQDPVMRLAKALLKVQALKFHPHMLPATRESMLSTAAFDKPELADAARAAATAPEITDAVDKIISADRRYNSLTRTTCVATMLAASSQENVLPTLAEATINCRIMPDETVTDVRDKIVAAIGDPKVSVTETPPWGPGGSSPMGGPVYDAVKTVLDQSFPGAKTTSQMQTGGTDSRYLRTIGIATYGVSGIAASMTEARHGHIAHGPDERVPVKWLAPGARFLRDVALTIAR